MRCHWNSQFHLYFARWRLRIL